jgi:hypothetical protein
VDIFPTLNDILGVPFDEEKVCSKGVTCHELQGKSLAPVILGYSEAEKDNMRKRETMKLQRLGNFKRQLTASTDNSTSLALVSDLREKEGERESWKSNATLLGRQLLSMSELNQAVPPMDTLSSVFAISQSWRCAPKVEVQAAAKHSQVVVSKANGQTNSMRLSVAWRDCDRMKPHSDDEVSVMGYSMRTLDYRYTVWLHYSKKTCLPDIVSPPFDEEVQLNSI